MQAEDIIETINVQPLGQRRLLQAAIEELRRTPAAGPSSHPRAEGDQQPPVSAVEVLRQLGIGQRDPVQPSHPQPPHSHRDTGEPPVPMRSRKPLDIVDFVRGNSGLPERVLYSGDGEQLVLTRESTKLRLEQVSPSQWMAASLWILRELVACRDLAPFDLSLYSWYLEKVSDLASKYTWASVLSYDKEYRKWQCWPDR